MAVVKNLEVTGVTITPSTAAAGSQVSVTVSINRPAPVGGLSISVIANPSTAATVPSSVFVPEGSSRVSFKAKLNYVGKPTAAKIYANHNSTKHASIDVKVALVQPVPPKLIIPSPVLSGIEIVTVPPGNPPPSIAIPDVPSNLLLAILPGQVAISWDTANGATGYRLKRAIVNGGPYITIAILTTTSYVDIGLINGTTYYYVVTASNNSGESNNSSQVSATPQINIPAAPIGIFAIPGDSVVTLSWTSSQQATTYNVKRAPVNGGPYATIANIGSISYVDTTVSNGALYYYVITVVNANGESSNSAQVSGSPKIGIPSIPTGLAAIAGDTQIMLNWNPSTTATSYNVKRSVISGGPYTIVGSQSTTSIIDTGLSDGLTYNYVVSAVNSGGESGNSSQVSTTPVATLPPPTFTDSFSSGSLDTNKWIPSNWGAPGNIPGVNTGSFASSALDFSQGMLRISLIQTRQSDSSIVSVGGELQSKQAFGYGTYEWIYRIASTAPTPNAAGSVVSGSDCGGFTFINNSQTEIDFESEGQFPSQLEMTNWNTLSHQQYSPTTLQNLGVFHSFKFVWAPNRIDYYLDNTIVATHTQNVPTLPAYQMINFWGTNSTSFGGLATPGIVRYFYVKKVSFWAA